MSSFIHVVLFAIVLIQSFDNTNCFTSQKLIYNHQNKLCFNTKRSFPLNKLPPSKVEADDEPTPKRFVEEDEFEEADPAILEEAKYDPDHYPVKGQPWRRGETDGLEDPIKVSWRTEAEEIIKKACETVNAEVEDITWGLAYCLITIADMSDVEGIIDGPEVQIDMGEWYDESPTGTGPDYFWEPKMSEEEKLEYDSTHPKVRIEHADDPDAEARESIDTYVLSAIAGAVLEALNDPDVENRLHIVSRHEIMFASPGSPDVLITQKQFDAFRGFDVLVETRDPWKSNRTLKGKLVQRTALDVILNVKGRMVTIPNNFVYRVRLPAAKREKGLPRGNF